MEQESTYKNIAVIGLGAAGGLVSILLTKNPYIKVSAFDTKEPFSTLLPTGGGRCNLTYQEDDIKEFVKNYPRGSKFLLSVFSKFNKNNTIKLFEDLGIKTYTQKDKRVFPVNDSSKKTIEILNSHLKTNNFKHIKEKIVKITKNDNYFELETEKQKYKFNNVIIATGGNISGFEFAKGLGHTIISPKPSLCSLDIKENYLYKLAGLSFKEIEINAKLSSGQRITVDGDILFAHKFITGPAIFKLSALSAYEDFDKETPLEFCLKLTNKSKEEIDELIKDNSKKTIKNVFSKFAPQSYVEEILSLNNIDGEKQTAQIKKHEKEILLKSITEMRLNAISRIQDSEIVTAGGVDTDEINPKTMESKLVKGLYFIGEMLNIDGFTGGFNLQNCWSGAYICSQNFN